MKFFLSNKNVSADTKRARPSRTTTWAGLTIQIRIYFHSHEIEAAIHGVVEARRTLGDDINHHLEDRDQQDKVRMPAATARKVTETRILETLKALSQIAALMIRETGRSATP